VADIFINYRKGDGEAYAILIAQELSRRFGQDRVFLASRSISLGEDFTRALPTAVRDSEALLAVIGPSWLAVADEQGRKRLDNEADWVRREILEALEHRVRVVPVLVGEAPRLRPSDLPPELARLADLHDYRLDHWSYEADLRALGEQLAALVDHDQPEEASGPTFTIVGQSLQRVGEPRVVAYEHLRWLHPRFVEPANYGRVQELLADNGSVLLTGPPGSGRRATAQMLLHRLPDADGLIRELPDRLDSGEPTLDGNAVEAKERLLLDLSTSDERDYVTVLRQLTLYRDAVHERGAHLIVVLPHSRAHHLSAELGPPNMQISRPDGEEVFLRHLRSDGIWVGKEQLGDGLTEHLDAAPMRDIAYLALLVHRSSEAEPTLAFPHWLDQALEALTQWSDEVAKQVRKLRRSGQHRALLLATAMFSGAPAQAVYGATSELLKVFDYPQDDRPRLEREDLAEQLAKIRAKADSDGRVNFIQLAYDRAVRTHFWTYFPDLQDDFRDWVETAIKQPTLTSADRDELVTRFAEQALRTGRPYDLRRLVERWAERANRRRPSSFLPQAAKALERGLNDERYGFFFRNQLYKWSLYSRLPQDLAQVVVQVCSEVLAPTHPKQAMVRLHHIFRRHSGVAGKAARDALLNLVRRDCHLYSNLLDRVTREPRPEEGAAADTALFLELADPTRLMDTQERTPPLIESEAVQAQLVSGWKAVLATSSSPHCDDRVRDGLVACEDDRVRELLLDVLVNAGDEQYDALNRLYVIARDWAHAPGERRAERIGIADRLTNKIDSAQGINFTTWTST
jgi:hypothetical protein